MLKVLAFRPLQGTLLSVGDVNAAVGNFRDRKEFTPVASCLRIHKLSDFNSMAVLRQGLVKMIGPLVEIATVCSK